MRRLVVFAVAFLVVMALTVPMAFAQSETGAITGTVSDPTGAVVPNAKITVKGTTTGSVRTATTNTSGLYTVTNLQPAEYSVTAEAAGFTTLQRVVTVTVGSRVGLDLQLQVGQTGTTIEVAETATSVNTETQTLGSTVNTQQIVELPTLTRNPYALVAVAGNVSGAVPSTGTGGGVGYAINGQRSASTNIMLDGTANNDEFGAGVGQAVPLDAVQEFSVLTNNFTAEFGRATGGIVNVVTKSGTNQFHGSVYEFNRLSAYTSNDFNSNANGVARPHYTRNQFGYSVGGPVIKNKIFFFSSTEWTRVRSVANYFAYVPTSQLISASNANTQSFFSQYGKLTPVTVLGTASINSLSARGVNLCASASTVCNTLDPNVALFNRIQYTAPNDSGGGAPQNTYSTVNRVDYNMSDKTQMYVRFAHSNESDFAGWVSYSPYQGYNTPNTQVNNSVVYSLTRSFSPTFVSQTKVDFNRFNNQQPFSSTYGPVPTLYMNTTGAPGLAGTTILFPGYDPYTPGNGIPFGGPQNYIQIYEDLSKIWGKHQIRFGGSYNYLRDNRTFGAYETAGEYLGTSIPKSFENFLEGNLYQLQVAVNPQGKYPCGATVTADCTLTLPVGLPNFSRSNRYNDYSFYVQDAYKVTPRLTLNLGLRWEVFGTQHNKNPKLDSNYYLGTGNMIQGTATGALYNAPDSPLGKLWNTAYTNYGPRIGVAYDVFGDGKTSIRGGYGRAFERNFGNVTFNIIQNPPNYATISVTSGIDFATIPISTANLGVLSGNSGTKALPKVTLRAVDPHIKTAYADLFSFAVEHRFGERMLGAVEYSGSNGKNQYGIDNINRVGYGNFYGGTACTPGASGDPGTCTSRLRTTQYSNINFRTNGGGDNYNSMNVRWDVHALYGLNFRANYTWSHTIDNLSDTFSSGSVANLGWIDAFDTNHKLDRGNAFYDIPQRLAVSGTWEFGMKNSKGWMKQVVDGWQLAPILTINAGSPFMIVDCTNNYTSCPYAFATGKVPTSGYKAVATSVPNTYNYMNLGSYFDSSWYDPKTGISDVGTFPGNMVGRNRFRGPGNWNLDMGMYKSFFVKEGYSLQFRAEGYNFFNHPYLQNPGAQDVSAGTYATTSYAGRRFFQFALKFAF